MSRRRDIPTRPLLPLLAFLSCGCISVDGGPFVPNPSVEDGEALDAGSAFERHPDQAASPDVSRDVRPHGIATDDLLRRHCERRAFDWCHWAFGCADVDPVRAGMEWGGFNECVRWWREAWFTACPHRVAVERGNSSVDAEALGHCLEEADAADACDTSYIECATAAFTPGGVSGTGCFVDAECADGLSCVLVDYFAPLAPGCLGSPGHCGPLGREGDPCLWPEDCEDGNRCISGTCVRGAGAGESCNHPDEPCEYGLVCLPIGDSGAQACSRGLSEGERCSVTEPDSTRCAPGLVCAYQTSNRCEVPVADGEVCEPGQLCAFDGYPCPTSRRCEGYAYEGEPCEHGQVWCIGDSRCVEGICRDGFEACMGDERFSRHGCRDLGSAGEPCRDAGDCWHGHVCEQGTCEVYYLAPTCVGNG